MRSSVIRHPQNERIIVLHEWQIEATDGDHCAALLLSFFEYWHNVKLEMAEKNRKANDVAEMHGDERTQDETLLQFHTEEELERGLLGLYSKTRINQSVRLLESKGFISIHRNPNPKYKFDRTRFFLFHADKINSWLDSRSSKSKETSSKNGSLSTKNGSLSTKNGSLSAKNGSAIPKITTEITTETNIQDLGTYVHATACAGDGTQQSNESPPEEKPQEKPPTNKEVIAELVGEYRKVVPTELHAPGDYSFIGRLYNNHGYDIVLEAIQELGYKIDAGFLPEKPLLFLKHLITAGVQQQGAARNGHNKEVPGRTRKQDGRSQEYDEEWYRRMAEYDKLWKS